MAEGQRGVNSIVRACDSGQTGGMKPLLPLVLSLVLSGCLPLSIYHREGVSVTRMQSDTTECEVAALRDVPASNQIRRGPPRFVPGRRICDASGACKTRPGFYVPGEIYTVDVNKGLRERVELQCMAARGYAPVTLPACSAGTVRAAPAGITRTLPRLTPGSCVIRNKGGSWQIVSTAQ